MAIIAAITITAMDILLADIMATNIKVMMLAMAITTITMITTTTMIIMGVGEREGGFKYVVAEVAHVTEEYRTHVIHHVIHLHISSQVCQTNMLQQEIQSLMIFQPMQTRTVIQ
jgi:hypothetical protein